MINPDWTKEFPGMISVCDENGKIMALNNQEAEYFKDQGGLKLIGTSLYDCHSEESVKMIKAMNELQEQRVYLAEENGQREQVIQSPWYRDGKFAGLVEISVEVQGEIPLIKRD
jgi:transcriptional regulator with PAS, ATPase and Fis domain